MILARKLRIIIMALSEVPTVLIVSLLLLSGAAVAHAPQSVNDNTSLETALEIEDMEKSWVIYSSLMEGEALYFTFEIEEGERLLLDLIVPVKDGDFGFLPRMALMAPGIPDAGALPGWVEEPDGYGHDIIETSIPEEATYEGFTPSAFYDLGRTDSPAPVSGRYYVVVFSPSMQEGNFALVVGYAEEFTLQELVIMPFSLYTIYIWEGQEPWQVLAPMISTIALGAIAATYYRKRRAGPMDVQHALLLAGGLLILGTAVSTLTQTLISVRDSHLGLGVLISLFLITLPGLFGYMILRRGWGAEDISRGGRTKLGAYAALSVAVWAGYLIGPMLVIAAAVLPRGAAVWPRR